jgi:hypothetical protein
VKVIWLHEMRGEFEQEATEVAEVKEEGLVDRFADD